MSEPIEMVKCPICGGEAESGAVYSRTSLSWAKGKPNFRKRLAAEFLLAGETIGQIGLMTASYAQGIYCPSCHNIVISYHRPKKYFPDVKGS